MCYDDVMSDVDSWEKRIDLRGKIHKQPLARMKFRNKVNDMISLEILGQFKTIELNS